MIQAVQRLYSLRRMRGVFYGWWLVGISGFVMTVATVPFFHALGIWSVALESHFAWTRTQLFIAFVLSRIEGGIMGPLEGYLTDRLGARRMVLIGLLILGAGFLLFSRVENLWMFYASFMIMALGVGLGGWLPLMTVVNNWFIRRRSSAMGWASVLSRLGALVLLPAIAWAVDPGAGGRLGWQTTALIIGAIILLSSLLIPRFIRNRPEEYGQHPDGDEAPALTPANPGQATASSQEVEFTARQALRTRLLLHLLRSCLQLHAHSDHNDPSGPDADRPENLPPDGGMGGNGLYRHIHGLSGCGRVHRRPGAQERSHLHLLGHSGRLRPDYHHKR